MSNNEHDIIYIQDNSPTNNILVQPQLVSQNIDVRVIENSHIVQSYTTQTNGVDVISQQHFINVDIIDNRLIYNVTNHTYYFQGSGSARSVKKIYESYTIDGESDDVLFVYPSSSDITIILPSAASYINKTFTIKRRTGNYDIIISTQNNETIDDANSAYLLYKNESITIISDDDNWCII